MSIADTVAALPGGGQFAALWTQVNGDPGAINDLVSKLKSTAGKAESSTHAISRSSGEVGESWHGDAAHAFTGYMHRFGSAGSSVHAAIDKAATAIEQAADAVDTAKHQLNSIASRILDRVQQLAPLESHEETEEVYTSAVEKAVSEGCVEAQPVVTALVSHLEQTASAVHAAVTSGGFVAMTAANSGTYLPAKGKPILWNPIPHNLGAHGASTTPQSAGGGAGGGGYGGGSGVSSGGGGGATSGGPPAQLPSGNVKTWIEQAKQLLIKSGIPASKIDEAGINTIIQHESSGNPNAQNNTDSNAAAGHPSKGIMQTIDSTFNANALPGHHDIWNPVDNIAAAVRYAINRYGSIDQVPGVEAVNSGGSYVGY